MHRKNILFLLLITCFSSGCIQYQDLLNYEQTPVFPTEIQDITNYQPTIIQVGDILQIEVSSLAPEAAAPFNRDAGVGYLVNTQGMITLPTLGDVSVLNKTLEEAKNSVQNSLRPYFSENPIVNIRLANFKINVNGEVGSPGVFQIPSSRITILEAITRAGDFTPYSRRDSILIVREINNERSFGYIDFNSAEVFESPFYYLKQNDVIYIRPSKSKVATVRDPATRVVPFISIVTGLTALILTIFR